MAILLSAIVALLPLILTPHLLFYYDITPKIAVLAIGAAIALPLALRGERAESPGLRIFGALLIAQAASLAVSTAFSTDAALSLGGSMWRRFGLITQFALLVFVWLVAQYTAGDAARLRRLLRVIAVSGMAAAIYGILQYFGWDPLIDPKAYHIGEAPLTIVRPPGTLGYVSYFATYLLSVIFAGAALAIVDETRAWKLVGAAAAALGTAALALTGTRAAMLGLVCGAAFVAMRLKRRIGVREGGAAAAAVAIALVFYFSPPGEMLRSRTRWFVEDPLGGGRLLLWRDSLRMASARWPLGFGPETFSVEFPRFQSAELARAQPDYYQESPHNMFLDALAGQGLVGLAILLGIAALGFRSIRGAPDRKLAAALGAGLVAAIVSQQFTSFTLATGLFFYLTVALLVGQAGAPVRSRAPADLVRGLAGGVLSLFFAAFAVQLVIADATLARVDRLLRSGKLVDAATTYEQFEPWQPPGMRTDLWYSRTIAGAAQNARNPSDAITAWQQGFVAAVRASRNAEERQNAWFNLATFYGRQNDFPHTEQCLRASISQAPNWFKPHLFLARVLRAGGRLDEARAEAARAADVDGGKNPEVTRTIQEIRTNADISEK